MPDDTDIDDNVPDVPLDMSGESTEVTTVEPDNATDDGKATETDEVVPPAKEGDTAEGEKAPEQTEQPPEAESNTQDEAQAQAQRQLNAEMAARRVQERQQVQRQVAQQLDEVYGPKTAEQFVEDGIDPVQAEIQALRAEMAYSQQRTEIAELNAGMQSEAVNAMADFPIFNEKSPDYDEQFTNMVQKQYQTAARLQTDDNGIILNAEIPLYDFYKNMNDIYSRGSSKGASQGQADAMAMLSRTDDTVGGSSSTNKGKETLEEMGERLADMPLM